MTLVQQKLIDAYTVLVLAGKKIIEQVPDTEVTLVDGAESTIRKEVEIKVAEKTIEVLSQ